MAYARDWQLILLPETADSVFFANTTKDGNESAAMQTQFQNGLSLPLSRSLNTLVSYERAFDDCTQALCGQETLDKAFAVITKKAPNVQLVIVYSLNRSLAGVYSLNYRLLDPLSFAIRHSNSLNGLSIANQNEAFAAGQALGRDIELHLQTTALINTFSLTLSGFLLDELAGLSTYILSNSPQSKLLLLNSREQDHWVTSALISNEYQLQSKLSASQLKQLLQQYFNRQNLEVSAQYTLKKQQLNIQRLGNPNAPSLITTLIIALLLLALLAGLVRRQYLHFYLQEYTRKRNAEAWLSCYEKASFRAYGLKSKWGSQLSYWRRLLRDADDFAKQAKVYFDAGDVNTAKVFLSKAMHANSANQQARSLLHQITDYEANTQQLSENEQWIHNKVAKAMNNYRQQQVIKALRRAYQAHARATQDKGLKRQAKAIKKLINKIKTESKTSVSALMLNCSSDPSSHLICQNQSVQIGRLPSRSDTAWISNQDSVFYINHKSISRIGQQCQIERSEIGFELVDLGSKNGNFVNQERLEPKQRYLLQHGDVVQLGSKSLASSVRLDVNLSNNRNLLQLSFAQQTSALLDKLELNKIWPDNALATRTTLSCVQQGCMLLFNPNTRKMLVADAGECRLQDAEFMPVCAINLGQSASIAPCDNALDVQIDATPLLGEVPLICPCNVAFICKDGQQISFQLSEYDSDAPRYAHTSLLDVTTER